ncbi:helix-turn-helix transcriptional regulator [Thalassospira sp.]|uniref:helix-turn-helix domain-containing protein n=1 Tax=Thalassospira sp. TaxID=1912094 RepID=UPI0027344FB0|nr:helix-turn-helix transcriptional regulator [Thalassospira sp.]MDP2699644.1 helix-turn-helix transcriptional regulator [Thalassospira sp.]
MNDLAGRLKSVRVHLHLSSAEMAKKVGLQNRKSWEGYEKGSNSPKAEVLCNLARSGIDAEWLLTGEGEMLRLLAQQPDDRDAVCQVDEGILRLVITEAEKFYRMHHLRIPPDQFAKVISLGYAMMAGEKIKGNDISTDALHFIMRAGLPGH